MVLQVKRTDGTMSPSVIVVTGPMASLHQGRILQPDILEDHPDTPLPASTMP